ncbi:hypothetical protein [Chondromyces crocatus]|uniref:Uncharacterized protein n=1 Tax=Chondromyces crocatus TaxID=52 RepID=A0A0K1EB17_CHOCO|nr:hypothetical protein [Chondromyces crocatus]AKT37773.1 uncharacterized protein CMC5_019150 [Chondromyces crocatus]
MRRVSARWVEVATLVGALLVARGGAAQNLRVHGVATASVGVTDNILSTPESEEPEPGEPAAPALAREADGFGVLSPGLVARYDTPRTSQTLRYTFIANLFFRHSEANSYTNTLTYAGRVITSPTTQLSFGAVAAQGQLNTFIRDQGSGQTPIEALPGGGIPFLQGALNQGFTKQMSPTLSLSEALAFMVYAPQTETPLRNYTGTGTLSAHRYWNHDTGAILLRSAYTHFDNVNVATAGEEPRFVGRDQLVTTLAASWIHDYGRYFSHQLDLGVSQATDLNSPYGQLWQPVGLAALRYTRAEVQAEAAYSHTAAPNVYLGQLSLLDQVSLRAAVPLSHAARLSAVGSVGLQRNLPIVQGELGNVITIWLADASLQWVPVRTVPELRLALRYQHINQVSEVAQIVRNSLLLSATFTFPQDREAQSQIAMTQPFGDGQGEARRRPTPTPASESEEEQQPSEGRPQRGRPAGGTP